MLVRTGQRDRVKCTTVGRLPYSILARYLLMHCDCYRSHFGSRAQASLLASAFGKPPAHPADISALSMASTPGWPPTAPTEGEAESFKGLEGDLQRTLRAAKAPYVVWAKLAGLGYTCLDDFSERCGRFRWHILRSSRAVIHAVDFVAPQCDRANAAR